MPRTEIQIEILGLEDLRSANTALSRHDKIVAQLGRTYAAFGGSVQAGTSVMQRANSVQQTFNRTLQETEKSATGVARGFDNVFTSLLKYRVASEIFAGVTSSVREAIKAFEEYDYQAARTTRITGGSNVQVASQLRVASSETGLGPEVSGEAYYQLGTYIKDTTALAKAFRSEMQLISGTEGDARETTRASIQVYQDFGDQLGKNVDVGEKFRRANELLAIAFKDSNAEIGEIAQALKYLAPIAETAGVKVEQLFAVMSTLTAQGVRGRMEGTEAGQFISRIIKAYNDGLQGIEFKDRIFHFDFAKDAKGGLDLIRTLEDINRRYQQLQKTNASAARDYITAIGGTQQAIRFLGSLSDGVLQRMQQETDQNTRATQGLTHTVENLNDAIAHTANREAAQAWQTFMGVLSTGLADVVSRLKQIQELQLFVKGLRADLQMDAARQLEAQTLRNQTPIEHAITMRNALKQASQIGTSAPYDPLDLGGNVQGNHVAGHIGLNVLRASRVFQGAGATDLDALLQLLPVRFQNLDALEFGPGAKERYVTSDDIKAAIAKIETDIPKFQAQREAQFNATSAGGALSITDVASLARRAGFSDSRIAEAVAIAMAESSLNPGNRSVNSDRWHSVDRGLWQINNHYHSEVSDSAAFDPLQNAIAAFRISNGGMDWSQWSTYRSGAFKKFLPEVTKALGSGSGTPSITDAPDKHPEKTAIEHLQDRINLDKEKLRELETSFADDNGLDAFKKFASAADLLGKDWKTAQLKIAQLQDDQATVRELSFNGGVLSDYADYRQKQKDRFTKEAEQEQKDRLKDRQDAIEKAKDTANVNTDIAQKYLGVFDPLSEYYARVAQKNAIALAQAKEDDDQTLRLKYGLEGPLSDLMSARNDKSKEEADNAKSFVDWWNKQTEAGQNGFVSGVTQALEEKIKTLQYGTHPDNILADRNQEEMHLNIGIRDAIGEAIKTLSAIPEPTKETADEIQRLRDRLIDANKNLSNFSDRLAAEQLRQTLEDTGKAFDARRKALERNLLPVPSEQQGKQRLNYLQDLLTIDLAEVQRLSQYPAGFKGAEDAYHNAQDRAAQDAAELRNERMRQQMEKDQAQRQQLSGEASSFFVDWYHGGNPLQLLAKMGDKVVTEQIDKVVKGFFDPQVTAVEDNTRKTEENTKALANLSDMIGGTGGSTTPGTDSLTGTLQSFTNGLPNAAPGGNSYSPSADNQGIAAPAPLMDQITKQIWGSNASRKPSDYQLGNASDSSDNQSGQGGKPNKTAPRASNSDAIGKLGKYTNDLLAGYSIFNQGMQQGSSVGGVLGGAMAGASIGGAIPGIGNVLGAVIGGGLNLLGGLFHHSSKPDTTNSDTNPGLFNSPDAFDYSAYRYLAFTSVGKRGMTAKDLGLSSLPTLPTQTFGNPVYPQPINLHLHLADGTVSTVNDVMSRATQLGNVALTSHDFDNHQPV